MTNPFDVGVSYQEDFPAEAISEFVGVLESQGLKVDKRERPVGVYMAMEWAIPTVVIAYLAKPYFEAFLSEAGKDHYAITKRGILTLIGKLFPKPTKETQKRVSLTFSIHVKTVDECSIKFVFPEGHPPAHYDIMISSLHTLMVEHLSSPDGGRLGRMLQEPEFPSMIKYMEFSLSSEMWVLIDQMAEGREMARRQKGRDST